MQNGLSVMSLRPATIRLRILLFLLFFFGSTLLAQSAAGDVKKTESTGGIMVRADAVAFTKQGSPLSALHPPLETLRTSFAVSTPVTTIADKQGRLMQVTNDGKTKVQKNVKLDKQ